MTLRGQPAVATVPRMETEAGLALMLDYFRENGVLGPAHTEGVVEPGLRPRFHDNTTEAHQALERRHSCMLIGRKGAGKTSLLYGANGSSEPRLKVRLDDNELYQYVATFVASLERHRGSVSVDDSAAVWRAALAVGAIVGFQQSRESVADQIDEFARGLLSRTSGRLGVNRETEAVGAFLELADGRLGGSSYVSVMQQLNDTVSNGVPMWLALSDLTQAANDEDLHIKVYVDSFEELVPKYETFEHVVHGALRLMSRGALNDDPFDAVLCLPAEIDSSRMTTNPIKDLAAPLELSWKSRDIVVLCGRRLRLFYSCRDGDPQRFSHSLPTLDFIEARRILMDLLPDTITNNHGLEEETLTYILRHTQLLPRHAILIFNRLFRHQDIIGEGPRRLDASDVRAGVRDAEALIVGDILSAYGGGWPDFRTTLTQLMNQLPLTFSDAELHTAYNRTGGRDRFSYPEAFERMVGMGIVGQVVEETERYMRADFAYTRLGERMNPSSADVLCMHPIFSRVFGSPLAAPLGPPSELDGIRPILPRGSSLD